MLSQSEKWKRSLCPQCWDYSEQYQTLLRLVTDVYCSSCIDKLRGINQNSDKPLSETLQKQILINDKRIDETLHKSIKKYNLMNINNADLPSDSDSDTKEDATMASIATRSIDIDHPL